MAISEPLAFDRRIDHAHSSGVSWGAVIGGAFVTAALSLILLALGAGFGLSSVSPWSGAGASAAAVGTGAIVWLVFMQAISSSMGGYLTGRLRTRWISVHTDEVHFRDTANGFLAWAVAVVMTVAFLTTAAVTMATGNIAEPAASGADPDRYGYFVDQLFRADHPAAEPAEMSARAEAARILATDLNRSDIPQGDLNWLARLVSAGTGLNEGDAARRVSDTIARARQTEDTARRAAAHVLLWIFLALLIGAFCASYAATIGGRQRDRVETVQR